MTPELKKAFDLVKKFHPTVSIVAFNKMGQWQYMDENFKSFDFDGKIDADVLLDAADSIVELPFIYQE